MSAAKKKEEEVFRRAWTQCVIPFLKCRYEKRRLEFMRSPKKLATGGMYTLLLSSGHIERRVAVSDANDDQRVEGSFVEVAAGHGLWFALTSEGGIEDCKANELVTLPSRIPPEGKNFIAVAAGSHHGLALRRNGSVACWGYNRDGQAPRDGVDGDFVAIDGGLIHSLALRRDGSVHCWGDNTFGQAPPDGVKGDFIAIAAGFWYSLALRRNGSIACWGWNNHGQAPPEGVDGDFVAIAAGDVYSLALQSNGTVVCFGDESHAPKNTQPAVAIAAGVGHCLTLHRDGSLARWYGADGVQRHAHLFGPEGEEYLGR